MISENPLLVLLVGSGFCVACLGLWYMSRHWLPLAIGGFAFLITVVLLGLSIFIETPREQVTRTVNQLAMAVQYNDVNALLEHISPNLGEIRQAAEREMQDTKFIQCWIAKIHDIQIDETKSPPHARVNLALIVGVQESVHSDGPARGRVQLWLDLQKESDGKWRVTHYSYTIQ